MLRIADRTAIALWCAAILVPVGIYAFNPLGVPSMDPRLRLLGVTLFRMPSRSMEPTIAYNTIFGVSAWRYARHEPRDGDLIALRYPPDPTVIYLKRIIASGGESVAVVHCEAVVNGQRRREPYIQTVLNPDADMCNGERMVVPKGQFYVLGDNRETSADSRTWGFVPAGNVLGKAIGY
jgi:signal peptidase I